MAHVRNPGEGQKPTGSCADAACPFHGTLKVHGRTFTGVVKSAKAQKTVAVAWETRRLIPKYGRYKVVTSKLLAHKPDCLDVHEGDEVIIRGCRPISKTKRFVVVEKIGSRRTYSMEKEALQAGRQESKRKADAADAPKGAKAAKKKGDSDE